jgi:hypothetical protein
VYGDAVEALEEKPPEEERNATMIRLQRPRQVTPTDGLHSVSILEYPLLNEGTAFSSDVGGQTIYGPA